MKQKYWEYLFVGLTTSSFILFILTLQMNYSTSPYWGLRDSVVPSVWYPYYALVGFLCLLSAIVYFRFIKHNYLLEESTKEKKEP